MMPRPYQTKVIIAAPTRDLTTLATVKAELGITNNDSDDFLQMKIKQNSDAIARSCNRDFAEETLEDHFTLDWATCRSEAPLVLSRIPVTSVLSVLEGNSAIAVSDYEVDRSSGLMWRIASFERRYWYGGKIVVQFVGGYQLLPTLPYDLEQACILMVQKTWYARSRDPLVKSVTINDVASYQYNVGDVGLGKSGFPPDVESLIAPYRRPMAV